MSSSPAAERKPNIPICDSLSTPSWLEGRDSPETSPYIPLPPPDFSLAHPDSIIVPEQAKSLTVVPPPEDLAPSSRGKRNDGRPRKKPHSITVVPNTEPVAVVTSRTPLPVPPPDPRRVRVVHDEDLDQPEIAPLYADPAVSTGIPHALGMRAFATRADAPWRHGG